MFLLKPPMCNSSLLRVRKEKTVKATYWGSRPVKAGHSPAVKRGELHDEHREDTCLDTALALHIVGIQ